MLRARGVEVLGLDISETALRIAKERDPDGKYIRRDIRDITGMNSRFTAVLSIWASFGYLSPHEDLELLSGIYSVLNPGGVLILDVYNRDYFENAESVMANTYSRSGKEIREVKTYSEGTREVTLDFGDHKDFYRWNLYSPTGL